MSAKLHTAKTNYRSLDQSLEGVCLFVCLFVSRLTQNSHMGEFSWNLAKRCIIFGILRSREELFKFWKWSETYSGYQTIVSAATLRLLGFPLNGATMHVCGCTGTTVNINLLHLHARGNDTVPISVW